MNSAAPVFDTTTIISVLTGAILPWLIARITSSHWPDSHRAITAFLVCVVFGALVAYLGKTFTGTWTDDPGQNIYIMVYNFLWLISSAWGTFSRFWTHFPAFRKIQEAV